MSSKIVFFCLILLCTSTFFGQKTLECDLIELTKLTLEKSPIIQQNELRIQNAEGNVRVQSSVFDYGLVSGFSLSRNRNHLFDSDPRNDITDNSIVETNTTGFSLGLQRRFRLGMLATVGLEYNQLSDNLRVNRFNQQVSPFIPEHLVTTTFSLTQPLLRGGGYKVVTALEKASKLELKSSEDNYEFTTSLELLEMITAYWQYLAAYKNLIIFKDNEERVNKVLFMTRELVKADKKPEGDVTQIRADLIDQQRQTTIAQQNLYNARVNLGRIIGLTDRNSESLGMPKDDFPTIEESGYKATIVTEEMISIASENRKDLASLKKIEKSLDLQLNLANNNLKPQLDLTGFGTYGGMNMGNGFNQVLNALGDKPGRNYEVGVRLNFAFPLNNNLAKGNYTITKTALQDQEIRNDNLQRNIAINVNLAITNLKNSVVVLKKAAQGLELSQEVFDKEQIKFQNGLTTLLNLILIQQRLTLAQSSYLNAQQQFAIAIANLRHETGTLISMSENAMSSINKSVFYSIPKG